MFQCKRFYTDKNVKNIIISNSYTLRNLKGDNQEDKIETKTYVNNHRTNNKDINIKRVNT